jgi:hypothetical protein
VRACFSNADLRKHNILIGIENKEGKAANASVATPTTT